MKFQTNVCPLCDKVLKFHQVSKVNVYSCPTNAGHGQSHYEVEYDKAATIQHMYVGDWCIDNYETASRSRIYKRSILPGGTRKWVLMTESHRITPDSEANILNKLEQL